MKLRRFDRLYQQIVENITTVSAGVGATNTSTDQSSDSYAPGDARTPTVLGMTKGKKKKAFPIIRRNLPKGL